MNNKYNKLPFFCYGKWVGGYRGGLVLEVHIIVNASGMLQMQDQPIFCKLPKSESCYFSEKTVFAKMKFLLYETDKPQRRK